ncbi:DNA glycosylase [Xylaria castorea]|nr:DNA glycosylase [Xylaria castorea]
MSEETSEQDAVTTEPCVTKEPSFHGRLQLKDFAFNGTSHAPPGTRRSPRLWKSQTPSSESTTLASASATASEAASPAPGKRVQKRKTQSRRAPGSPSSSSSRGKTPEGEDGSLSSPSPRKKKKKKRDRASSSYAPPSTYAHLPPLIDVIAPNLLILFIGLNPGVQTARTGHAYAHPSNLFWRLLHSSGITPVPCRAEEDGTLPERFSLGNTNIVARPSRNGAELSRAEMDAGVAILEQKCRRWRPEVVCVVGKGIWESIFRVWKGRNLAKAEFDYGWQTERMGAVPPADDSAAVKIGADVRKGLVGTQVLLDDGADVDDDRGSGGGGSGGGESEVNATEEEQREKVDDGSWEGARIFVATSTSGLAASLRPEEKEKIWKVLGDWCVQRRKERAEEKEMTDA